MPPKFDPTAITEIILRCVGGEAGATASLAPKVGPLGLAPKKIGDDIAKAVGPKNRRNLVLEVFFFFFLKRVALRGSRELFFFLLEFFNPNRSGGTGCRRCPAGVERSRRRVGRAATE
jgi:hypothetical protein